MYIVYVLHSEKFKKFYIGHTQDLLQRLWQHNEEQNKKWTSQYRPWKIVHTEKFSTKAEAMQREKYLKSLKGGNEWKKLFSNLGA